MEPTVLKQKRTGASDIANCEALFVIPKIALLLRAGIPTLPYCDNVNPQRAVLRPSQAKPSQAKRAAPRQGKGYGTLR